MTNVPVKRGEAARQKPQVAVTDADREAAYTLDALIGTVFNSPSNEQIIGWCTTYIARARAEGREAFARECEAVCPPAGLYTPGELSAYEAAVQDCAAAIRARGEGGKA